MDAAVLERIGSLTVIRRQKGESTEITLTRIQRNLALATDPNVSFTHVDLGDLGGYTVASTAIAAQRLHAAVQDARHAKRMSDEWADWHDAVVSLAVPAQDEVSGRMFMFLPMGDKTPSPFAGHLNARSSPRSTEPTSTLSTRSTACSWMLRPKPRSPPPKFFGRPGTTMLRVAGSVIWSVGDDPHLDRLVQAAPASRAIRWRTDDWCR
ncbi:hypothetical protein [Actinokineospora alba]|uniref:hypothetical protein n=1 Tax=Actinokineospora alba TaxID=504798 RepID=UPI000B860C18|nr:hypothetical protein [Actinokineospora alba]